MRLLDHYLHAVRVYLPKQSISGLLVLCLTMLWWTAVPGNPSLVLGSGSAPLQLTTAWQTFYWPILILLLVGAAQRAITLARPQWNGLQFVTRLCTNGLMLAMVYPILQSFPLVVVAGGVGDEAAASLTARRVNDTLWWHIFLTGGVYWLIVCGWHAWVCLQRVRSSLRHHREVIA